MTRIVELKVVNGLGREERGMMLSCTGPREPLDYPRVKCEMADGQVYEEYLIPAEDRVKVFNDLYLFDNPPGMDDIMMDLHSGKTFRVSEYKAIRQDGGNFIVAPLYGQYGGTLLDWVSMSLVEKSRDNGTVVCCNTFGKRKELAVTSGGSNNEQ